MTAENEVEVVKKQYSGYIAEHKKLIQAMLFEAVGESDIDTNEEAVAAVRALRERAEKAEKRLAEIEPIFKICSREEFERRKQCEDLRTRLNAALGEAGEFKKVIIGIYKHIFADLPKIESPQGNRLQNIAARCTLAVPELNDVDPRELKAPS